MTSAAHNSENTVLSGKAYLSVRSAILTGKLPLGSQLVLRELSESLGLSPTPIKSALTTLESEGLVRNIPYRGFFIADFGVNDVLEIYSLREALERKTARLAAQRRPVSLLERLTNTLSAQVESAASGNAETHVSLDLAFHEHVAAASGNSRLRDAARVVLGQAHLVIATTAIHTGRYEDIHAEHEAVLSAIAEGNPDQAEQSIWRHNRNACLALLEYFEQGEALHADLERAFSYNAAFRGSREDFPPPVNRQLSDAQKDALRSTLADYIGPMAVFVCSDVLARARTLRGALEQLAERIPDPERASAFTAEAAPLLNQSGA